VKLLVSSRRKAAASSRSNVDDTQLEFTESMRRTQEAGTGTGCLSRWCCHGDETQDKYAVDILATEIDTLQRAVKEVSTSLAIHCNILILLLLFFKISFWYFGA